MNKVLLFFINLSYFMICLALAYSPLSLAQNEKCLPYVTPIAEEGEPSQGLLDLVEPTNGIALANPRTNAGPARNPLKGWNSGWWMGSDTSKTAEVELMTMTSVGYQTIEWGAFEPSDDEFDWCAIESILNRDGSRDRHIVLQFHVDWNNGDYKGPAWLQALFEDRVERDDNGNVIRRASDYDDQDFIDEASEALTALMDRYKDDPRIHVIQIGLLGYFGEWHTFPKIEWQPTVETQEHFFNLYKDEIGDNNFLQARFPDHPVTIPTPGMGYTNGWVLDDEHGREFGDYIDANDIWPNGPITGEWPPSREPDTAPEEERAARQAEWDGFWGSTAGLNFVRTGHYSYILPPDVTKIARFVDGWTLNDPQFQQLHREMGYNFQLSNIKHYFSPDLSQMNIEFEVSNVGLAPFYEDWDVQLAILDGGDNVVQTLSVTDAGLKQWMPGETNKVAASLAVTFEPNTNYRIGLRISQPGADLAKDRQWALDPRNTYVVISNDVPVIDGVWDSQDQFKLSGGWNILDDVQFNSIGMLQSDDEFCFPLVAKNGNAVMICL